MKRKTIKTDYLQTISWLGDKIVDWAFAGTVYSLDGKTEHMNNCHFDLSFDSAITSQDGQYSFVYKRLGTKGLLLKNGELLREINRSYYQAEIYEYPAVFVEIADGRTVLVHCPLDYCRLDFEDVETGEIITNVSDRKPSDVFRSRLEVSPNGKYLISKGWIWHPWDILELFDIEKCLADPKLLDNGQTIPKISTEICSASFIDNDRILVCSAQEEPMVDDQDEPIPPGHLAIWNFKRNEISNVVKIKSEFGNLIAIDDEYCWDLFRYPKIINLKTGEVEEKIEEISAGLQASSIINHLEKIPKIAYNRQSKKLALENNGNIEVLWRE
jgi:hypothetical protein